MTPPDTSAPAVEAMIARLLTTAKLLYANAVGCAVNHYGEDFVRFHGKPGWLSDCEQDILDAEEAADMLATLSSAQVLKLAAGNMLLCRFRVDDELVWSLLTNQNIRKVDNEATSRLHASILMAGRVAEIL